MREYEVSIKTDTFYFQYNQYDVIERLKKPFEEENLDKIADEAAEKTELPFDDELELFYYKQGVKAGYKMAKEE